MAQPASSMGGGGGNSSTTSGANELFFDSDAMRKVAANHIPNILPHERVFPVQIGSELFKLSGASISSDGASSSSLTHHSPTPSLKLGVHSPGHPKARSPRRSDSC